MKWKIGAGLMAFVFLIAILPPLLSGAGAGDLFAGGDKVQPRELVMQEGNARAVVDGRELSLGDSVGAAVYRADEGDVMAPVRGITEAMELVMEWDNPSQTVTLTQGSTTAELTVGSHEITGGKQVVTAAAPAINIEGTLFVPVRALAQAFEWAYAEHDAWIMLSAKKQEFKDDAANKLAADALTLLGHPRSALTAGALVFRAGSDVVIESGVQIDLTDEAGDRAAPFTAGEKFYLPAKAVALALGGTVEDTEDGITRLHIDGQEIALSHEGKAMLNGEARQDADIDDVLMQDETMYLSSALLSAMLGYDSAGEGNICMIGALSFANAISQVAYLTELGDALPDRRPVIPKADAYVALTFDDGPTGGPTGLTARLLDGLYARGAKATFFMCGYRVKDFHSYIDRYLAEGHEVANHTMDHPLLTKLDYAGVANQIASAGTLIETHTGELPTLFRPVGGAINDNVKNAAGAEGLPVVNWSVDTLDWKHRDADNIKKIIVNQAKDGDIVLMHDLRECTLEGALAAIDELERKGYAFVTVSELAHIKGVEMKAGEVYTDFRDSTVQAINDGTYKARY